MPELQLCTLRWWKPPLAATGLPTQECFHGHILTSEADGPYNCIQFALNHILQEISTVLTCPRNIVEREYDRQPWRWLARHSGATGQRCEQQVPSGPRRGFLHQRKKESAGLELGTSVYVSSDPPFCAQFTRSTKSILTNKLWYGSSKKKKKDLQGGKNGHFA